MQHNGRPAPRHITGSWSPRGVTGSEAVHCGTAMVLFTPRSTAADYTFGPAGGGPVHLPPVWRCSCGFQLDARLPGGDAATPETLSAGPSRRRTTALSA
ncbi:hypothetical protein ACU18_00825 [Arthrobacter sp. ZBG10]|nr:hypothetical protein ACU18_00825 [Arthrobacter sp. ZBG10]